MRYFNLPYLAAVRCRIPEIRDSEQEVKEVSSLLLDFHTKYALSLVRRDAHEGQYSKRRRIEKLAADFLPTPRILHPLAQRALRRQTPKVGAVCGETRTYGSVRGGVQ